MSFHQLQLDIYRLKARIHVKHLILQIKAKQSLTEIIYI